MADRYAIENEARALSLQKYYEHEQEKDRMAVGNWFTDCYCQLSRSPLLASGRRFSCRLPVRSWTWVDAVGII